MILLGALQVTPGPSNSTWMLGAALLTLTILAGGSLFVFALRRMLRGQERTAAADDGASAKLSTDNPVAFMTASMQAVIQKLREQEKELAALHRSDRERAQQTEKLSEAVTRNMPAGLLLINSAGLITIANPAAETALGVRGLSYRRCSEALGSESSLAKLVTTCLTQAQTYRRAEIEYTTPAGELRWLGVTISPIQNDTGEVTGALCLLSDLTELATLQHQVRVKESLAALGELSAGIAHEFKNSLATISGYAQMIRAESRGEPAENARLILEQTRSLAHVVTEFLKFARPLDISSEEIALDSLLARTVAEVRDSSPGVEISVTGDFEHISGDDTLLRQALLNLVRNAAEAAGGQAFRGQVRLHGAVEQVAGRAMQRISISDNGPGIPSGDLAKIFVPFYTTKTNGTGLGLAIVQKIVLQHGGSVEARNKTEGGAELIVWLPSSHQRSGTLDSVAAGI
jgi:two-component system sensor histidine kinase HydH